MLPPLCCPDTATFFVADYISDLPQLHDCCFYVTSFNFPGFRRSLRPVGVHLQVPAGVAAITLWNSVTFRRRPSPSIYVLIAQVVSFLHVIYSPC
jgi:hypothetical protein